ncbi:hypothetical protein EIB72_26500 [Burkholderia ambifaria]|uniref:hypothetical protein n=1 Tax=Burkholderia ambifaria TaxID=152480 RepID=UPI0013FDAFD7|nr:hypothetical protein [Burkholderia ambifaria]NHL69928.1 hypothetical protein [Burkholderia ambifaria]
MIESGGKAVYEAIVRRKSRAAIWRAIAVGVARGRPTGRLAEISAFPAGRIPKSRPAKAATLSADETNPL